MKSKMKLGIYAIGLLMMGVIGINSSLATIGAAFPDISQTMIQNLISIPCIAIIPTTLIVGKLMEQIPKKYLVLAGSIFFTIGGIAPSFMTSFTAILVMRALLGVGVGICQVVSTAIAVENFEGEESQKVQGNLQSAQMIGAAVMVFLGGNLAAVRWNYAFLMHAIGIVALVGILLFIPTDQVSAGAGRSKEKVSLTGKTWLWALFMCLLFITMQVYNVTFSYIVVDKSLGTSADAGLAVAFFTIGGAVMGILYGKLNRIFHEYCISIACVEFFLSFLLIANAGNMAVCYLGSTLFGFAVVTSLPGIFIQAGLSVDAASAGFAVSVVTCAQNFGQFLCPYIINPVANSISPDNSSTICFLIGAALAAILAVVIFIWAKSVRKTCK